MIGGEMIGGEMIGGEVIGQSHGYSHHYDDDSELM